MSCVDTEETTRITSENKEEKWSIDSLNLGVHCTKDDRLKISIISPSLGLNLDRLPAILCCVVDVSGSMGSEAIIKDSNGNIESHGLTILDLVKHSIKTIIHCLNSNDYLSIVSYSSKANKITELIEMSDKNKTKTLNLLNNLNASGQTNLWDGLYNGLEILRTNKYINCINNNCGILLFTDGLPNIIPPKGHIAMLDKYIDTNKELIATINTYGFGYSLDTKLLTDLAIKGNGNYSFIPDSSFVGTIFVNSISNFCSNMAKNCIVKIETNSKYDIDIIGGYNYLQTSWGIQINLGNISYGQNKDIILKFTKNNDNENNNDNNTIDEEGKEGINDNIYDISLNSLNYISLRNNKLITKANSIIDDDINNIKTEINYFRLLTCDTLRQCMRNMKLKNESDAQNSLKELINQISNNKNICKDKYICDLLEDLSGQAFEAISKTEYYDKWGKHYLPSLIFAHLHQYNNNFKDPGVQHYGGKLFNKLRDNANDIFIKLPPPKPSKPQYKYSYNNNNNNNNKHKNKSFQKRKVKPKPVDMRHYYNASGGCFEGNGLVLMNNNRYKYIKNLCVNDILYNGYIIKCVIKYKCDKNKIKLSNINGLLITQYHPILINNKWIFPINITNNNTQIYKCDFVYNFVLNNGHIINVNGIKCCTLGHGITTNNVIKHEYFGTQRIINDLKTFNGWKNGIIYMDKNSFQRNENNLVIGIAE